MTKKYIALMSLLVFAACAGTSVDNGLTRLEKEPKNCEFLYTLNTSTSAYKVEDAYDFLEKSILEQEKIGNSYYVASSDVLENKDAIFGPKNTFKFKAKVYRCKK